MAHGTLGRRRGQRLAGLTMAVVVAAGLVACSDDDSAGGDDPDEGIGEIAESGAARVVAEAIRVTLVEDDGPDTDRRKVEVLQESVDDLPGEPDVSGIADDDGDGLDDDGNVEVRVNDEVACITVSEAGRVDVTGGGC